MDLYSTENVADTLARHAEAITDSHSGPEHKKSYPSQVSPPVIQRSAVLKALQEDEIKGRYYTDGPPTPPMHKKQPPSPPPKPKPPLRDQVLHSATGAHISTPLHHNVVYSAYMPEGSSSQFTQQDNKTAPYQQRQQFYKPTQPYTPSTHNDTVFPGKKADDYYQQRAAQPVRVPLSYQQKYTTPRAFQPTYQQPATAGDQPSYKHTTSATVKFQQPSTPAQITHVSQPSYQQPTSPKLTAPVAQPTYQQPARASDQPSYQHKTTTSINLKFQQPSTPPPQITRVNQPTHGQPTSPKVTTPVAQPKYQQKTLGIAQHSYQRQTPIATSTQTKETSKMASPLSEIERNQRHFQGKIPQTPPPAPTSQQIRQEIKLTPSPTLLSHKSKTSEGIWPPKNSTARELPRTGFLPGWVQESSEGKKLTWPPLKSGESGDEIGGRIIPVSPPRGGAVPNSWHTQPLTPPCRTPPFTGGPPAMGRRKNDIIWPPPQPQEITTKTSSNRPLKKDQCFEDYIFHHASVTIPPTYRPPPGTHHIQPTNA
ncbi:pollen-specific leucine-rich repeat extensin-like protein 2 [Limulus polyphemus]|uniref:Pollen-specific leucine-rich repeat extensin-like protein 2 n=1 Tax=Limulus polyphemus TaxID=6850 RepID=A0ABM1BD31_LIMPO|nr:pollen-specific leucine-rich repeat extensin-like protein 2 [Limulus polyphemus]